MNLFVDFALLLYLVCEALLWFRLVLALYLLHLGLQLKYFLLFLFFDVVELFLFHAEEDFDR